MYLQLWKHDTAQRAAPKKMQTTNKFATNEKSIKKTMIQLQGTHCHIEKMIYNAGQRPNIQQNQSP